MSRVMSSQKSRWVVITCTGTNHAWAHVFRSYAAAHDAYEWLKRFDENVIIVEDRRDKILSGAQTRDLRKHYDAQP